MSGLPARRVCTLGSRYRVGRRGLPLGEVPSRLPQSALTGSWRSAPQAAASGSGCHSLGSAASGHSRNFCQSRAVALVEVIGQMEGMRPPSTRMMLPVM